MKFYSKDKDRDKMLRHGKFFMIGVSAMAIVNIVLQLIKGEYVERAKILHFSDASLFTALDIILWLTAIFIGIYIGYKASQIVRSPKKLQLSLQKKFPIVLAVLFSVILIEAVAELVMSGDIYNSIAWLNLLISTTGLVYLATISAAIYEKGRK